MAHTRDWVLARVASVVAGLPERLTQTTSPFTFKLQPDGAIDGAFRVEVEHDRTEGRFGMTEEQTDRVTVWVARRLAENQADVYATILRDLIAIRGAVIRDGHVGGGDYLVEATGGLASVQYTDGHEFLVGQVVLPINYDVVL